MGQERPERQGAARRPRKRHTRDEEDHPGRSVGSRSNFSAAGLVGGLVVLGMIVLVCGAFISNRAAEMSALEASGTLQDQHLDSVLSHPVVHAKMQELNRKLQRLHQSGGSRAAHSGGGEAMQKLSQLLKHTAGDLRGQRMMDAESESDSHSTMDSEMDPSEIEHQGVMEKLTKTDAVEPPAPVDAA